MRIPNSIVSDWTLRHYCLQHGFATDHIIIQRKTNKKHMVQVSISTAVVDLKWYQNKKYLVVNTGDKDKMKGRISNVSFIMMIVSHIVNNTRY